MEHLLKRYSNRFYVSAPPDNDDEALEKDWHDYSRIIITTYMEYPWFKRTHPNPLDRRDYLEKYVNEFYDNCLLNNTGTFRTSKRKGSKYEIVSGVCVKLNVAEPYFEAPQNLDEIRLNYMNKRISTPLKEVATKYKAEVWYLTMNATEISLVGEGYGSEFTAEVYRQILTKDLYEWYRRRGIALHHPPLIYAVTIDKHIYKYAMKRDFFNLGAVVYSDPAFGEVTDYVVAVELPGGRKMLEDAKSRLKPRPKL